MKKLLPLMVLLSLALVLPALADDGLQTIPDPLSVSINIQGTNGTTGKVVVGGAITFAGTETINNTYNNTLTNNDTNNCTTTLNTTITKDVLTECTKDITYIYTTNITINSEAEAIATKCDINAFNCAIVIGSNLEDYLYNSFNGFNGIGQVNQASGCMDNQGNLVGAAVITGNNVKLSAGAQAKLGNFQNQFFDGQDSKDIVTIPSKTYEDCFNDILNQSFNNFNGLGQANQSAGYMNNQNNVISLAADPGSGIVACADSKLSMCNTCNQAFVCGASVTNNLSNSFSNYHGVGQVNQSAGSMNNQANVVAVCAGGYKSF